MSHILLCDPLPIRAESFALLLADFDPLYHVTICSGDTLPLNMAPINAIVCCCSIVPPDVIILLENLNRKFPNVPILLLSNKVSSTVINLMKRMKLSAYVVMNQESKYLKEGLHEILQGNQYLCPCVNRAVMDKFLGNAALEISKRELEIIRLIADDKSTAEIAESLYISAHTVGFHRRWLHRKMGVRNSGALVKRAFDAGLL